MHLIFEDIPIENAYSNCTILTLAWAPFYDDDLFRQFLRTHLHPQQQQANSADIIPARSVANNDLPDVDRAQQGQSVSHQHHHHHHHYNYHLDNQSQQPSASDVPEYAKKFTNEGRSDRHGWLAVGNINGTVGVALTKCNPKEEELVHLSDHDEEQQNEDKLDEEELLFLNDSYKLRDDEGSVDRRIKLHKLARKARSRRKRNQSKTDPTVNQINDPDNEAFRTNHHLRGHGSEILIVKWNEAYQRLATVDSKGCIFIWSKRNGRFQIESPLNNRNKSVVDFDWSNDGETALICYIDSFVLVGSGYGQRYWHSMLNLDDYHITCGVWSPDDDQLIFGVSNGSILIIYLQNSELTELVIRERYPIRSMCWSMGSKNAQRLYQPTPIPTQQQQQQQQRDVNVDLSSSLNQHHRDQLLPAAQQLLNSGRSASQNSSDSNEFQPQISPRPVNPSAAPWSSRPLRRSQPGSSLVIGGAARAIPRAVAGNHYSNGIDSSLVNGNNFVNTNYYHLNRINTAIRWRQDSTAALFNHSNNGGHQSLRHPIRQSLLSNDNPIDAIVQHASTTSNHSNEAGHPSCSHSINHQKTHNILSKNVLAVDFCDGTIQLYSGGLEDPDPFTITTNMKGLHMQWSYDGQLLAVAGFFTVSSLSLAASIIQKGCSGHDTKYLAECLAMSDEASGKKLHPIVRPTTYYLNMLHFYTPQGQLRHSQIIKYCAHPVSALTWGHKDRRLFVATGPVLHSARVYTNVPSLQILAKTVIKQIISSRKFIRDNGTEGVDRVNGTSKIKCHCIKKLSTDLGNSHLANSKKKNLTIRRRNVNHDRVYRLPLPMRLLQTIDDMFSRTLRSQVPNPNEAREFIWKVPDPNVRFYCTLICYDGDYPFANTLTPTSSPIDSNLASNDGDTIYILYIEYLGSLVPILKAKRIGNLKPEFIIYDPQVQAYPNRIKTPNESTTGQSNLTDFLTPLKSAGSRQQRTGRNGIRFSNLKLRFRSKSAAPSLNRECTEESNENGNQYCNTNVDLNNNYSVMGSSPRTSFNSQLQNPMQCNNDRHRQPRASSSSYLDLSADAPRDNYAYDINSQEHTSSTGVSDLTGQYYASSSNNVSINRGTDASYLGYPDPYQRVMMLGTRSFRSNQYLHHYHAYDNLPEQNVLAKVKSNFWGTKFRIAGVGPLPETIATMIYKTSLLHLQPRQVCITIKDLNKVCSKCFRLTDLNDDTYLSSLNPISSSSVIHNQMDDRELSDHENGRNSVSCSSSTVFLEVGDNLRIAPMNYNNHRPSSSRQRDLHDNCLVHCHKQSSSRSSRHHKRHHHRTRSSSSTSTSISNDGIEPSSSVSIGLKSSNRPDLANCLTNDRSSKKRPSSSLDRQYLESSVQSPSKKMAIDSLTNSNSSSYEQIFTNFEDNDEILTLYVDKEEDETDDGNLNNTKKGSTTSISMKLSSSRSSSINELFLNDVKSLPTVIPDNNNDTLLLEQPSTSKKPESTSPLLSISTITKMIVDLSSKAAKDEDLLLVDTSSTNKNALNVLDTEIGGQYQQFIPSTEDPMNPILPPTPQTPVHRPRRTNLNNARTAARLNPCGSMPNCSRPSTSCNVNADERSTTFGTASQGNLVDWSKSLSDHNHHHPLSSPTPATPKRRFTKKLREHFKNSALSLNIGSSSGFSKDDDELQVPLLQSCTGENHSDEDDYDEKRFGIEKHRKVQSQPCTPMKSSAKSRSRAYANCDSLLRNVTSSSNINTMVDSGNTSTGNGGMNGENKENSPLNHSVNPRRRCQSTTKLVSKAFRQRFNYFDCSSKRPVECNQNQSGAGPTQSSSRPPNRAYEDIQYKNNKYPIKVIDLNHMNIDMRNGQSSTVSKSGGNDDSGGPNIDWYLREHRLFNKPPVWNAFSQVYQLDFGGRVTQESAKNFQIEYQGELAMQFGRIDSHAYTLDFQYPFNALQAMGVALASLTQRLK